MASSVHERVAQGGLWPKVVELAAPVGAGGSRLRLPQVLLGVLWLADGALQLQPLMFGRSFVTGMLLPSAAQIR